MSDQLTDDDISTTLNSAAATAVADPDTTDGGAPGDADGKDSDSDGGDGGSPGDGDGSTDAD